VLIKDNHLAGVPLKDLAAFLTDVAARAKAENPHRWIEVEVDTLDQLREVLKVDGVEVVLLDNMDCPRMTRPWRCAIAAAHRPELEASGGVTLETVRAIALTGVERIAVGAITHSAPALDIGMDVEEE
jgi:nicotinate-nucleotide pyrophosphorylase (carboxylating)